MTQVNNLTELKFSWNLSGCPSVILGPQLVFDKHYIQDFLVNFSTFAA